MRPLRRVPKKKPTDAGARKPLYAVSTAFYSGFAMQARTFYGGIMSKSHRGKGIRSLANHGRGVCGRCKKENIKTLYEHEVEGQKIAVCKFCNAAIKNGKSAVI